MALNQSCAYWSHKTDLMVVVPGCQLHIHPNRTLTQILHPCQLIFCGMPRISNLSLPQEHTDFQVSNNCMVNFPQLHLLVEQLDLQIDLKAVHICSVQDCRLATPEVYIQRTSCMHDGIKTVGCEDTEHNLSKISSANHLHH